MKIILPVVILIFSVIIHEISHGLSALWLGDPTAKYAGRLSFNPVKHLDLWGSFIVPLLLIISGTGVVFGWAKPVPYNPYNLRNQKYGPALVGLAGPLSNIILALIAGITMRTLLVFGISDDLLVFNALALIIVINLLLTIFNLLPIPPLDGSKLLFTILPISEHTKVMLERYGFIFFLIFIFMFSSILSAILHFVLAFFSNFVVGVDIATFL